MAVKEFLVPEIGTIKVYRRHGSKSIRLSVSNEGEVRVTLPIWLPYKAALGFVSRRQEWIAQHSVAKPLTHQQIVGRSHTLFFVPYDGDTPRIRVGVSKAIVRYPKQLTEQSAEVQKAAQRAAKKALLRQADDTLPHLLHDLALRLGYEYTSLTIRHLKTRWGSCNNKQEITLNYYLMQLPDELIEYVLVHELAHTKELNHSKAFWSEVAQHIPDYKLRKKSMKSFQPSVLAP